MQAPLVLPGGAPPVGPVAGFQPGPQPNPAITPHSYLDHYLDARNDTFGGNFINLYQEYLVGNTQPAQLRNAIYKAGNSGTFLHGLVHMREHNAPPDDPGTIVAVHRLVRHEGHIGQLPKPFDNIGLAFYGDVINGQAPATVTIPDAWFN